MNVKFVGGAVVCEAVITASHITQSSNVSGEQSWNTRFGPAQVPRRRRRGHSSKLIFTSQRVETSNSFNSSNHGNIGYSSVQGALGILWMLTLYFWKQTHKCFQLQVRGLTVDQLSRETNWSFTRVIQLTKSRQSAMSTLIDGKRIK